MDKPKYIGDAIFWNIWAGDKGSWVRARDLNLIDDENYGPHYEPAFSGHPRFIIRRAYPYEEWMEKYIGTSDNLTEDENFNYDY